jgi:Uncharacterized conserved protein
MPSDSLGGLQSARFGKRHAMIDFKEIQMVDQGVFTDYLSKDETEISELTFTNLFMWRHYYNTKYAIINNFLCVIATGSALLEPFAFFPIGQSAGSGLAKVINALTIFFHENNWKMKFKRVSGTQIDQLEALGLHGAKVQRDPDNDDYLYLTSDLMEFKGRKYSDKRNHINKFNKEHIFEYVPLTPELMGIGKEMVENWCTQNYGEGQSTILDEENANFELLDRYSTFGCRGALFLIDGSFEALFIGEMLNSTTAVIHLEKANRDIKGLYTVCTQQFCLHEWSHTSYINLEQDLGMPGLRQSKKSYNPYKITEKYVVEL